MSTGKITGYDAIDGDLFPQLLDYYDCSQIVEIIVSPPSVVYDSRKVSYEQLSAAILSGVPAVTNIYNSDGTLSGDRVVSLDGKTLNFDLSTAGNVGINGIFPASLSVSPNGDEEDIYNFLVTDGENIDFVVEKSHKIRNNNTGDAASVYFGSKTSSYTLKTQAHSSGKGIVITESTNITNGNAIEIDVTAGGLRVIKATSNLGAGTIAPLRINTTELAVGNDAFDFTIRQISVTTFLKSGTGGIMMNNSSDSLNIIKLTNTGQGLFGNTSDANYVDAALGAFATQLTSNATKQTMGVIYKNNTNHDGVYFASKQGVVYVQSYADVASDQIMVIGGRNSGSGVLDTMSLNQNDEVYLVDTGSYLIGDPTANGSWRFIRSGTDLLIERRESGSWVTKQTITA